LRALEPGLRDRDDAAALHVRSGRRHRLEAVLDLAAHQVGEQRAAALVRHVQCIDLGTQLEHLERQDAAPSRARPSRS
jgi:hypothetical protein